MKLITPTFTWHAADGSVTVDGWPEVIEVSRLVLTKADPRLLRIVGDRVHFEVANGAAEYVLTGEESAVRETVFMARLYARRDDDGEG